MQKNFLKELSTRVVLADGAIGTQLHAHDFPLNSCYEALNLSNPDLVRAIHRSYVDAGARLIETNTFTANRLALAAHGCENQSEEINKAGVTLAIEAAGDQAYVAGAVGPVSWAKKDAPITEHEIRATFQEQMTALIAGGIDLLILETFTTIEELKHAYEVARSLTDLPLITSVALNYLGEGEFAGIQPEHAAHEMTSWGIDMIGINCGDGPKGVFEALKRMAAVTSCPLSAMPSAGLPKRVDGRMVYPSSPEYIAEYTARYAQLGAKLIGGCCGTTPQHIAAMKRSIL